MSDTRLPIRAPTLAPGYRAAGLLLHLTSLPSRYGIGDMGPEAMRWIDCLEQADQTWWQFLPVGPAGAGNSPYSSVSSFAGNWLLISPDLLIVDGLLREDDVAAWTFSEATVDFDIVKKFKYRLLDTVWTNFNAVDQHKLKPAFAQFCNDQSHWLDDYALFQSLKAVYHNANHLTWPTELIQRNPDALAKSRRELASEIDQVRLAQFLIFRQSDQLKQYAHARGVRLIGDLPFYVSPDSSDVWANPELFLLDERRQPLFVAGVPPDYFSSTGQLWGNPVYDWEALSRTGYRWFIDRMRALLQHVDLIRLDHFRAFVAAWHVAAGAATAVTGHWVAGPGSKFMCEVVKEFGNLPFIAEDLGIITPDVYALRDQFHIPGTRVLQFAFDGNPDNPYLPHNYVPNTVVYTGTHDNNTTRGWFQELPTDQRNTFCRSLQRPKIDLDDVARALLQLGWSSVASLALAPLQDVLNLGSNARMNVPGVADGNWRWRCTKEMLSAAEFVWLRELTRTNNRSPVESQTVSSQT